MRNMLVSAYTMHLILLRQYPYNLLYYILPIFRNGCNLRGVLELDAEMSPNLLVTKLFAPPARPNLVPRPRLVHRLNEGLQSEPETDPGFGSCRLWKDHTGH